MKARTRVVAIAVLMLCGCSKVSDQSATSKTEQQAKTVPAQHSPAIPAQQMRSEAKSPRAEPQVAIDPKSAEAAGQVLQHYGALIEQKRWADANTLWGDRNAAEKFAATFASTAEVHLEIGNPGDEEGAAGSIYVTVPAIFYGDGKDGQPFRRTADVILRRVNDVPGSTEEQRRWHIERIEFTG